MSRCLGMVCAGVLTVAATGCTLDSFLTPTFEFFHPHQMVTGTVPEVSRRIENGLSDAGIFLISKQLDDGERRLAGHDKQSGKVFCIHLYNKKEGKVDRTLVSIERDPGTSEAFLKMIFDLAAGPEPDNAASKASPRLPVRPGG